MGYFLSAFFLSKSATETALTLAELVIIVSGLFLAFGAIGEYLEEHHKLPRWRAWPRIVFIVLVVTGLIGEFLGDAGVFVFSEALQSINDAEANGLRTRIQQEIDARLDLEEQVLEQGPRDLMLSGKRAETFLKSLGQFKGQKVQVRICIFDNNEVRNTAERLAALFTIAEWRVSPHSPDWGESNCLINRDDPQKLPSGLWVGTPSAAPTDLTQRRATELVGFLAKVPLRATLHSVRPDTARAESGVSIQGRYDDPDSIVVVVFGHPSELDSPPHNGPFGIIP